jgi:hypothetical protein
VSRPWDSSFIRNFHIDGNKNSSLCFASTDSLKLCEIISSPSSGVSEHPVKGTIFEDADAETVQSYKKARLRCWLSLFSLIYSFVTHHHTIRVNAAFRLNNTLKLIPRRFQRLRGCQPHWR